MGITKKYTNPPLLVYLKSCAWGGRQKSGRGVKILPMELELRGARGTRLRQYREVRSNGEKSQGRMKPKTFCGFSKGVAEVN